MYVVFWPSSIHGVFDCCLGLHGIYQRLKTSAHGLLRYWRAIPLHLWLIKCIIYFKQHGIGCPFLSTKPCSTPYLIRKSAVLSVRRNSCFCEFRTLVSLQIAYKFNQFVFMPYCSHTINIYLYFLYFVILQF